MSDSMLKVLNTIEGREVLCDILDCCYLFDFTVVDTNSLLHRAGKQQVGTDIINMILDADPEGYIKLQQHLITKELEDAQRTND